MATLNQSAAIRKPEPHSRQPIEGTIIFDGHEAMKGYGLNAMCFSFNDAANRKARC